MHNLPSFASGHDCKCTSTVLSCGSFAVVLQLTVPDKAKISVLSPMDKLSTWVQLASQICTTGQQALLMGSDGTHGVDSPHLSSAQFPTRAPTVSGVGI